MHQTVVRLINVRCAVNRPAQTYRFSKPGAVAGLRPSHLSGRGQETGPSAILTGSLNLYAQTGKSPLKWTKQGNIKPVLIGFHLV